MSHRYFTTPIYYVNDRPHIGHAYTTVLTDAITRWHQLMGHSTFFLTGTDEHGQKVQQAADGRGVTPQAHCDELHMAFKTLWPNLHIEPTDFIRTTEKRHKAVVHRVLNELWDKDLIYAKEYGGWYSVSEERFWTEKDLVDGKCPASGNPVEWIEEKNYFFKMSNYQQALIDHINENPDFIRPSHRRNEVLGFLRQPLTDLCISRPKSRLSWGIELPFDTDYVTYVWFDALLNYLTGIGYPDSDEWKGWWAESTHLIGKDILTTHSVYWTTMLMAMEVPLPKSIVAHGWWLMGNSKMSKTKGNVVDPMALKDQYGVEVFRYFLLRDMSVGQDASFSEAGLVTRNNTELANDLGNLVNRTLNLVEKRFDAKAPAYTKANADEDSQVIAMTNNLGQAVTKLILQYRTHEAVDTAMALVRRLNKYINDTVPFKVIKEDPERAASIIRVVLNGLYAAATWLTAVMPQTMNELIHRIGADTNGVQDGAPVFKGEPLFPKYDLPIPDVAEEPTQTQEAPKEATAQEDGIIEFSDFAKVDLRVAQVVAAEKVEGADKLLKLNVDMGDESRQIVAGIASCYSPDELVGKRVVLVANLKPRKIFGLESQGMILAARDGDGIFVVSPDGFPVSGAEVS
ncbi:MAG TPA: methionine--tRNA ligase [Myxococcales bacterium]|nr:methionine--tRNA ligase [Myxococcales bacterium]